MKSLTLISIISYNTAQLRIIVGCVEERNPTLNVNCWVSLHTLRVSCYNPTLCSLRFLGLTEPYYNIVTIIYTRHTISEDESIVRQNYAYKIINC